MQHCLQLQAFKLKVSFWPLQGQHSLLLRHLSSFWQLLLLLLITPISGSLFQLQPIVFPFSILPRLSLQQEIVELELTQSFFRKYLDL